MSLSKTLARKVVFPVFAGLGLEKVLRSFSSLEHLIFCYHGVSARPDFSINGRHISSKQMEEHLVYLKKNFRIVPVSEMFSKNRERKKGDKKCVALTFDDGYLNNYTTLLPLLEKYKVPAAFYIISRSLTEEGFINWPDMLDLVKAYSANQEIAIGDELFVRTPAGSFISRKTGRTASDHIKAMGRERVPVLEEFQKRYELRKLASRANPEYYRLVGKEELRKISACDLIEIGSHSHTHYNLGNVSNELAEEEIKTSKRIIEEAIDRKVLALAYPDGSYNDSVKDIAEKAGYRNQLAVSYKCTNDPDDSRILPRLTISNTTTTESNMIQMNMGFRKRGF